MNFQNPKFVLITIAILFFLPLLLAILMRSDWWDFAPENMSNRGQLVQPPQALPMGEMQVQHALNTTTTQRDDQWVILYPFSGECEQKCQEDISGLRQIHLATGRHQERVAIWLLSPRQTSAEALNKLLAIYSKFEIRSDPGQQIFIQLAQISDTPDLQYGQAFLLDPAANIILRYPPGFNPADINEDLDRLLAWSGKN